MDKKYIPINKGHFELDTKERSDEFQRKMSLGWKSADEYKKYRFEWASLPKNKIVRSYPLQVDIELSSACTLKCPMCYTITDNFKKNVKKSFMDFNLYKKIVDEICNHVYALRLSWRGESSLHPNFVEAIKYAKQKGIQEISFLTSGIKLDLNFFKEIAFAGVDWITISIDGMGDVYNGIRKPLKFEETLKKIKDIHSYKKINGLQKPVIKIQSIWPAIRNNAEEYYNTFYPITDLIAFNPIIDYLGKDSDIVYEEGFSCPQLYERIFIASNGFAHVCNSDEFGEYPVGDTNINTIYDIWHGEKISKIRDVHSIENGFKIFNMCKRCFYPRKMEPSEEVVVNGRKIIIENYINRNQKIGE